MFEQWISAAERALMGRTGLASASAPLGAAFLLWDIGMKQGNVPLLGVLSYAAPLLSTGAAGAARSRRADLGAGASPALLMVAAAVIATRAS